MSIRSTTHRRISSSPAVSKNVPTRVHLGLYEDETARLSQWHIPEAHSLEAWSDLRAHEGTATIVQPLIEPLYDGKSVHELLAALIKQPGASGHDMVRGHWEAWHTEQGAEGEFERFWRRSLHDGVIAGTQGGTQTTHRRPEYRRAFRVSRTRRSRNSLPPGPDHLGRRVLK